jgi:hypothetical protein
MGFTLRYTAKQSRDGDEKPMFPMPLASTCSAAISANCHRYPEDDDCWLLPVRWELVGDDGKDGKGRFTFTNAKDVACTPFTDLD